jgi:long-chain acyl-CoA synthetase
MEVTTAERYASGGEARELYAQNLALAFHKTVERIPDDPAIVDEERGVELTWREVADRAARIAGGLAKLGVAKGDTVALMLNNRWEFIPVDLGAVHLGGVPFSIYQTSSPEQT